MKCRAIPLLACLAVSFEFLNAQPDLRLELQLSETTIPVCAPLTIRVSMVNYGPGSIEIHRDMWPSLSNLRVWIQEPGSSDWIEYVGWPMARDVDRPPYALEPGEEVVEWEILLSENRLERRPEGHHQAVHVYVFAVPGVYLVKATFTYSAKVGEKILTSEVQQITVLAAPANALTPLETHWKGTEQARFVKQVTGEPATPDNLVAMQKLQELIENFPGSVYARYAREAFERYEKRKARPSDRRAWWPESGLEQPKKR